MRHRRYGGLDNCILIGALLTASVYHANCQMCGPNTYQFSDSQYFASSGTTNVTITIRFSCGCMGRSGYIDFATADGTAVAYQDYTPTNGTLFFANCYSPAGTFQVPINARRTGTNGKTIRLILTKNPGDPDAAALAAEAQLIINLPPPPNLTISAATNGTVRISWITDGTGVVLEKAETLPATQWTQIHALFHWAGGQEYVYTDDASGQAGFYRLRRPQ